MARRNELGAFSEHIDFRLGSRFSDGPAGYFDVLEHLHPVTWFGPKYFGLGRHLPLASSVSVGVDLDGTLGKWRWSRGWF